MVLFGKRPTPAKFLAAFLLILYLWTPYLNILPVPTFAAPPSPPSQNYGHTSLPPGTVTNLLPTPKLVQTQNFDYRIQTHTIPTSSGCVGNQGCLTWITPQGNFSFSKEYPFAMSYAYFGTKNNTSVSLAAFDVMEGGPGVLRPSASTVRTTATTYDVNTTELSSGTNTLQGYLDVKYDFASTPFKATATYTSAVSSSFSIRWLVSGYSYVTDPLTNATRQISSLPTVTNATIGRRSAVSLTDTSTGRAHHTLIDVHDAGNATFVYGRLRFFLGNGNATHYDAVAAVFPTNASRVDPTLVQMNEVTCSYVCLGGTDSFSFLGKVAAGDMLVVTVVTEAPTTLTVVDSLGSKVATAASATVSSCANGLPCNADIYWGLFPSSGPDTVTVSETASDRALRVQIWEFSGVGAIGNTVSCTPTCSSVSYPSASVLIATAVDSYGAGPGFAWYPYAASAVAGSELEIPTGAGSTSFPFSTTIDHVEAGAVLVGVMAQTATPPWGEPGLSPYESYVNNAVVYVSTGDGLVSIEQPTFDLPGRDLAVAPALLYNEPGAFWPTGASPHQTDNFTLASIANGWSLNLPWLGTYAVHLSNGQQYPYNWTGTDMQVHGPVDFELRSLGAGGLCPCVLTLPSGIRYTFNIAKQLVQENDTVGNTVTFGYGSNGMLSTVTDTVGRQIQFGYSGYGLSSITAPGGRTWTLSRAPNQLGVTDPVGRTTTFVYASTPNAGWLVQEVDYPTGGGRVNLGYTTAVVYGGVTYVAISRDIYNAPGSISQSDSTSYTFTDGVLTADTMTEADGTGTVQGYVTNVFSLSNGTEKTYLKDSAGTTFRAAENDFAHNRLTATKTEDPSANVLAESDMRYDGWGNVVYSKDGTGHETWFSYVAPDSYNAFGNPQCSVSGFYSNFVPASVHDLLVGACDFQAGSGPLAQQETFYQYNALGELTEQKVSHDGGWLYTDYVHDGYGNVVSVENADENRVYESYSPAYYGAYLTKTSQIVGNQNVTTYHSYDFGTSFETSQTNPNGQTTSFSYDQVGRLLSTTYPSVNGVSSVERQSYDNTNGIVTVTDTNGNVVKEYFDGLGRKTGLERWNGTSVYSATYYTCNWMDKIASLQTPSGSVYSFTYDSVGRLLSQRNPDGTTTRATYNDILNLVVTKDEDGRQAYYSYDRNGRLLSVTSYSTSTQGYTTSYFYDGVGNLLSVDNNIGQITYYAYDDLNRVTRVTGPDGNSTQFSYDSLGNLVAKTTANGAIISYTHDQTNRVTGITYPSGSAVQLTYDKAGNVLRVTSSVSGYTSDMYSYDAMGRLNSSALTVSGSTYVTSYSYDKGGNLVGITYPNGMAVSMTYDAVNRLKSVGSFATFAYNLDDTVASITFGDGEVQTYAYDSTDRPTSIVDASGNSKLMSLSYSYDNAGNVISMNNEKFTYDNMSRLLSAKGGGISDTYTYDGAGNMLGSTSKNTATVYDGCGYYPNSLSGTVVQCGTDRDGNVASKTGGWTYAYNYEDQMTSAKLNGVTVQTNVYDGVGNRAERTETDSTVFTYQGVDLLFEKDITTGATADHIYGNGMQLAEVSGGTTYYLHEDQIGSNRLVTYLGSKGKVVTQFSSDYEPYGENYRASGSESFQYTDRMLDPATGLYYFNARFYDPATMRLMTTDPLAGSRSDPLTLNPHAYAGDNPASNTDPTGLDWWNPLTWTPTQVLLFGAAVALTLVSVAQLGLDPITDALAGASMVEFLGTAGAFGAAAGLPMVFEVSGTISPDEFVALAGGMQFVHLTPEEYEELDYYDRRAANTELVDFAQAKLLAETGGKNGEYNAISTPMGDVEPEAIVGKKLYEQKIGLHDLFGNAFGSQHDREQLNRLLYLQEVEDYTVEFQLIQNPFLSYQNIATKDTYDLIEELGMNPSYAGNEYWQVS